jgi:hypothetical protein
MPRHRSPISPKPLIFKLISNHMDAWQVALVIATLPLLIHGAIRRETAVLALAIGVGYWFAFALNDYFDAPFDRLDEQKAQRNFFVQQPTPRWLVAVFFRGAVGRRCRRLCPVWSTGLAALAGELPGRLGLLRATAAPENAPWPGLAHPRPLCADLSVRHEHGPHSRQLGACSIGCCWPSSAWPR